MQIDKNAPMPPDLETRTGRRPKYPWRKMEVGDSIFIEGEGARGRAYMAGRKHGQREREQGRSFRIEAAEETSNDGTNGVRIWRVE